MKKLISMAMIALLCSAVFFPARSAGAGTDPTIPPECQAAVNSGNHAVIYAQAGVPVNGGSGAQVIIGSSGNDIIDGGSGNDVICGGGGRDQISGGSGNDRIFGNAGNDDLFGSTGGDHLDGGPGGDDCVGGTGSNTLIGCNDLDDELAALLPAQCVLTDAGFDCRFMLPEEFDAFDAFYEASCQPPVSVSGCVVGGRNFDCPSFGGDGILDIICTEL